MIRIHCEIGASQQSSIQFYQVPTCQTNEIQHHPMKSYGIPFANMWTDFQKSTKLDEIIWGTFCRTGSKLTKIDKMPRGTPRKIDVNSKNFNATLVSTSHQRQSKSYKIKWNSQLYPVQSEDEFNKTPWNPQGHPLQNSWTLHKTIWHPKGYPLQNDWN